MKYLYILVIGMFIGIEYSQYKTIENENQVYGSRNIESELKSMTERVNLALDTSEKKYINKPKVSPDNPNNACKCNGTKEIVHGDGHKTPCTCEICRCKPSTMELVSPQTGVTAP